MLFSKRLRLEAADSMLTTSIRLMKRFSLLFAVGLGFTLLAPDLLAQPTCPPGETPVVFNLSIDGGDPTSVQRLFRADPWDDCGLTDGTDNFGTGPYSYDIIALNNITGASQCVVVAIDPLQCTGGGAGASFLTAGIFSPAANTADWSINGLADIGASPTVLKEFSADVPPGPFEIAIIEATSAGGCDAYIVYACDAYIPVELISFDATIDGSDVMLRWETSSETNNSGFEVQMMGAGDWEALGFVEGHGTTTEVYVYHYDVADVTPGAYTFRLKQIDFDGGYDYSPEIEVTIEVVGTHHLTNAYPNPFNPQSQFEFVAAQDQHVSVVLFNTIGQQVAVLFDGNAVANQAQIVSIEGSGLSSGVYVVRLVGERFTDAFSVTLMK